MTRWLTLILLVCLTTPLFGQGKANGKKKSKKLPPAAEEKADESRVVFGFDPGSHTRPISAMSFNKDQSRLITVGWDYTIQIWCATTGERLDIIRLPAFGRDNGFDSTRWNQAAISADGAFVAIGGGPKLLFDDKGIPTRLLIIDLEKRQVRKLIFPADPTSPVTCLDLSANGDRLVVGFGGVEKSIYILDDVIQLMRNPDKSKLPAEPSLVFKGSKQEPSNLALSQTGNKLVVEENRAYVRTFDLTGKASEKWKQLGEFMQLDPNDALEWSPDESQFVWSWRSGDEYFMELRSSDCKLIKKWQFSELKPGFDYAARVASFRYLDANRLFISAHAVIKGQGRGSVGVMLDPQTGKTVRHFFEESSGTYLPFGTASADGKLAATTTSRGLAAVIYSLAEEKTIALCGSRTPVPTIVGWGNDTKVPTIAWSDDATLKPLNAKQDDLEHAFDLVKMEPIAKFVSAEFALHRFDLGESKLIWREAPFQHNFVDVQLKLGEKVLTKLARATAMTLISNGENPPLLAHSVHDQLSQMGSFADIQDGTGKPVADLLPVATHIRDMVSSPDGRYLLMSTGTHRLSIYRTDGSRFPFLNLVQASGEWVCWMPEGYYAASPGGEKLIGWAESKGSNEFPVFHAAEKFAKEFRRPDILKLALEKGSLSQALESLKVETR